MEAYLDANRLYGAKWSKETHKHFPQSFQAALLALVATRALTPANRLAFPMDVFDELCEDMRCHRARSTREESP